MFGFGFGIPGRARPGGGSGPPIEIPVAKAIANLSSLATLLSPAAVITDAATVGHPAGAATALQIVTSGNTTYTVTPLTALGPAEAVNVTDGYVQIPFRPVGYCEQIGRWSIELHSEGTPAAPTANYHQLDPFGEGPSALKQILTSKTGGAAAGRWQVFQVHGSDFTAVGTGANLSAIKFARLTIRGTTGYTVTLQFGSIRFQPRAMQKAACVIYFDDGHTSVHDTALPLFQAKGFKSCFNLGALLANLDVPGRMSSAQVTALVAAGWELHGQAYTSEDIAVISAMTDAQRAAEMTSQQAVATAKGWGNNIAHGSYFSGVDQTQQAVFPMFRDYCRSVRGYFSARGVNPPMLYGESYPYADRFLVRALAGDHTSAQLIAHCEQAIKNKGLAAFVFHSSMTSLSDLLDYLDANRGSIEVLTEADLNARYADAAWSPSNLGGALKGWFDFEDVASLSLTGSLINSVTDKASGLVLSQSVSESKPLQMPASMNGRGAAYFDGVDDYLAVTTGHPYPTNGAASEIWALCQNNEQPLSQLRLAFSYGAASGNTSRRIGCGTVTGGARVVGIVGTGSGNVQPVGQSLTEFSGAHVIRAAIGAASTRVYDNGTAGGAAAVVPATSGGYASIGSGNLSTNNWLGLVNCALVINPDHPNWTPESQAALLGYLKTRGGIA